MSQSDYIKHKKIATELKFQTDFSPVLKSQNYTLYKEFSADHTKNANKIVYSDIRETDVRSYFDMVRPETCEVMPCQKDMVFRKPMVYRDPMPVRIPAMGKSILQTRYCQCRGRGL